MSKGNTLETDLLKWIMQGVSASWFTEANLYYSLHTADPGDAGSQTTSEATYTNYSRVTVARSDAGATVVNNLAVNATLITFPTCEGGSNLMTHFAVGTTVSGAGTILYSGALNANLSVTTGVIPQFGVSTVSISED